MQGPSNAETIFHGCCGNALETNMRPALKDDILKIHQTKEKCLQRKAAGLQTTPV